jgi:protein-tyrosine phosphatase
MNFDQITENLFVGGQLDDEDWEVLRALGVTVNLNLREEKQDVFDGIVPTVSFWLPTPDLMAPSMEVMGLGARLIGTMVDAGYKVYVHCHYGVGRAPIVGAAYLVTTGMSADEALALMRRKRPYADPNSPQIERLREFASQWERERGR